MYFPDSLIHDGFVFIKTRQWVDPRGWEKAEYHNAACHSTTSIVLKGDFVSPSI